MVACVHVTEVDRTTTTSLREDEPCEKLNKITDLVNMVNAASKNKLTRKELICNSCSVIVAYRTSSEQASKQAHTHKACNCGEIRISVSRFLCGQMTDGYAQSFATFSLILSLQVHLLYV